MTSTEKDATIIARWGGEEALSAFLDRLLADLCPLISGSHAPLPVLQLKPSWLASGVMGGDHAGADYEPSHGDRPATIGIFPRVLKDEAKVRSVLIHELIHHWEHLGSVGRESLAYLGECDALISSRYSEESKQRRWRSGHSQVFIAKAAEVARRLNICVDDFLFERRSP